MPTYYWIGGAGTDNASATSRWSLTSGGASAGAVPGAGDIAVFDSNSGTGTVTRTRTTSLAGLEVRSGCNITFAGSANFTTANGNLIVAFGVPWNYTGTITLSGTCGLQISRATFATPLAFASGANVTIASVSFTSTSTLTINGVVNVSSVAGATATFASIVLAIGTGNTWTAGSYQSIINAPDWTVQSGTFAYSGGTFAISGTFAQTGGTVAFAGGRLDARDWSRTAGTLTFGTGARINLSGSSRTVLNLTGASPTGSATITLTGSPSSGTRTVNGPATGTSVALVVQGGSDTVALSGVFASGLTTTGMTGGAVTGIVTAGNTALGSNTQTGLTLTVNSGGTLSQAGGTIGTLTGGTLTSNVRAATSGGGQTVNGYTLTVASGTSGSGSAIALAGGKLRAEGAAGIGNAFPVNGPGTVELAGTGNFYAPSSLSTTSSITLNIASVATHILQLPQISGTRMELADVTASVSGATLLIANDTASAQGGRFKAFSASNLTLTGVEYRDTSGEGDYAYVVPPSAPVGMVFTGTGTVNLTGCTIKNTAASPASTWFAPTSAGNTDAGGNSGWQFSAVATRSGNWLMFFV